LVPTAVIRRPRLHGLDYYAPGFIRYHPHGFIRLWNIGLPVCSLFGDDSLYGGKNIWLMKTIAAFIVGLLIATAWAQQDNTHNIVWLPGGIGYLNGKGYQTGLRHDGVVVWRWSPYH
jgi:hypothetical protein